MMVINVKGKAFVVVIVAVNCLLLFFLSLLAERDGGGAEGIYTVWIVGYFWIAAFAVAAYRLCMLGKNFAGIAVAAVTLPAGYVVSLAVLLAGFSTTFLTPDSPEFKAACEKAHLSYVSKPSSPVHSIAYDRGEKRPSVELNHIKLGASNRVASASYTNSPYPPQIEFTEEKSFLLSELGKQDRYFRYQADHSRSETIPEFTADVLVSYRYIGAERELREITTRQGVLGYEVIVKDRRSDQVLASMVYFTHMANNRACGPAHNGVISVREFVLKAIGVT